MKLKYVGVVLILVAAAAATSQSASYDPASKAPRNSRDGIVGFALKQLNPENQDYGQLAAEYRRISIEAAIERVTFWVAVASLAGCLVLLLMLWHASQLRLRQEIIAGNFLAMYHNGWARASSGLNRSIEQYNLLVQKYNAATERLAKLRTGSSPEKIGTEPRMTSPDAQEEPSNAQLVESRLQSIVKPSSAGVRGAEAQKPKRESNHVALLGKVSDLQQQLTEAREREKSLRRQLDLAERRGKSKPQQSLSLFEPATISERQEVPHGGQASK
jgi:hypothetical protein